MKISPLNILALVSASFLCVNLTHAAVVGVDSVVELGANDAIGWGQLSLPVGQGTMQFQAPLEITSTSGQEASVAVGDLPLVRVDQAPGGIYFGNFAPGSQLISSSHNYEGILITFDQPVYGGGAQVASGYYGSYVASVTAFAGSHALGTFSLSGTTTTAGLNNPVPFIGVLSDAPNITSLLFFADSALSPDETVMATLFLNARSMPAVPEAATWAMMLLGFSGLATMINRRGQRGSMFVAASK